VEVVFIEYSRKWDCLCLFQSGAQKLKALDDLYIDDEGDDDIQLQDEASGFGSTHRKLLFFPLFLPY